MRQEKTQGRRPQKATQPQPWELPPQPITRTLNHPPLLGLGTAPSSVLCSHTVHAAIQLQRKGKVMQLQSAHTPPHPCACPGPSPGAQRLCCGPLP